MADLFDQARSTPEPDHGACAKYADLLARLLLPKVGKGDQDGGLEEIRKKAMEEIRRAKETA